MKPGPEMDKLVAQAIKYEPAHIMVECDDPYYNQCKYCYGLAFTIGDDPCDGYPPFSTDIAAAWIVVEKLDLSVVRHEDAGWAVGKADMMPAYVYRQETKWINRTSAWYFADTAPHAICLAALKAVGVNYGG